MLLFSFLMGASLLSGHLKRSLLIRVSHKKRFLVDRVVLFAVAPAQKAPQTEIEENECACDRGNDQDVGKPGEVFASLLCPPLKTTVVLGLLEEEGFGETPDTETEILLVLAVLIFPVLFLDSEELN